MLLRTLTRSFEHTGSLNHLKKIGLAVSGGVDSMALASVAAKWARPRDIEVVAFIVDHKLRAESTVEARSVSQYLGSTLGVRAKILTLFGLEGAFKDGRDEKRARLEDIARQARRTALMEACEAENLSHLVLAHHQNDQVELFIQRLLAGSSWYGLAGMRPDSLFSLVNKPVSGSAHHYLKLLRPFLQHNKQDLITWCAENNIQWWEDASNQDISLTLRNRVRRMYQDSLEPAAFRTERLVPLLNHFGEQRSRANELADAAYRELNETRSLTRNAARGSATLVVTDSLRSLPIVALGEVLLRITAPISHLDEEKIATRRRKLDTVARSMKLSESVNSNILGVQFRSTNKCSTLTMTPEAPRRNQSTVLGVFSATKNWSEWILLDNRWYIRWKLPNQYFSEEAEPKKLFTAQFPPRSATTSAKLPRHTQRILKRSPSREILLTWGTSQANYVDESTLIGFPALKNTKGLDVEIQPKTCSF